MITRPNLSDLKHLMDIINRCTDHLNQLGIDQWNEHYPTTDLVRSDIALGNVYTYREDEAILGLMTLGETQPAEYEHIQWSSKDTTRVLTVYRLAVDPKCQGRGIARKLIEYAEHEARSREFSCIRMDCYTKNKRAYELYRYLNYELKGTVVFPHTYVPFYCLEKVLS
ncbi:GNAT family N-acetyltransferase [Paenibacillus terrigena]|uniref:GNAT family N-acetyltransferase n=1 Tax=Paenibacillus terrigena TaxID=369333 RepID=UPI00036A5E83|nr:GNAT family N-acetyltransferase [Paenibacillus terrigena]